MATSTTARSPRSALDRAGRPLPTSQRRPGYAVLGVALVLGLTALGTWLYANAGSKTPVVVVVSEVPVGHVIDRADVSTVAVAGDLTAIAGQNVDSVVGQSAAVTLLPGMLLQRSMVAPAVGLDPQQSDVGVAVTSGQIPADGLKPGDTVRVLRLPETSSNREDRNPAAQELVSQARVFAVRTDPAQAGGTLLTLTVPASDASAVAAASGAEQVALVRVAQAS